MGQCDFPTADRELFVGGDPDNVASVRDLFLAAELGGGKSQIPQGVGAGKLRVLGAVELCDNVADGVRGVSGLAGHVEGGVLDLGDGPHGLTGSIAEHGASSYPVD